LTVTRIITMPAICAGSVENKILKFITNSNERRKKMQKGWLER